jgi:hypothetical protein
VASRSCRSVISGVSGRSFSWQQYGSDLACYAAPQVSILRARAFPGNKYVSGLLPAGLRVNPVKRGCREHGLKLLAGSNPELSVHGLPASAPCRCCGPVP